jgi:hypothetical protein
MVRTKKNRTTSLEALHSTPKTIKLATFKAFLSALTAKKKNNHPQNKCWWSPNARCFKCGQLGHMEKICKTQQQQTEAKVADDQHQEEHLFVVSCLATNKFTENWLIDSGCTNHMTHDGKLFTELDRNIISKVKIGNRTHLKVEGKGIVAIETHSGFKLISDVLYVPEINQNLLSVSQLLDKGYKVLFEDKSCVIEDAEGIEVFNIQMKGKSFVLDFKEEQAAVHKEVNNSLLWHKRMWHYRYGALFFMEKNNMVKSLPKLEKDLCCLSIWKAVKTSISTKQSLESYTEVATNSH